MAIIGSIVIGMTAQTDKFVAGLNKGLKAIEKFGRSAASVAAPAARMGAMFGGAAVAGIGAFAASMAEAIDKTGDAADRLGTTTAALSELRYAAKLSGSEAEALDAGLNKLSINLGKAATEGGPAGEAIKRLGLDAKALASQDPTEAFRAIAGGFQSIPNEAEKAALAVELFGKNGTQLLNTLNAGPAELAKFGDEFRAFGGSVSETSRQQVATMMDSLDRAKAAVGGVGTQIAVQLSPFVEAAANEFVSMLTSGGNMGDVVGGAVEMVSKGVGFLADGVQWVKIGFLALEAAGAQWGLTLVGAAEGVGKSLEKVINLLPGVHVQFTAGITTLREELEGQAEKAGEALNRALGEEAWSAKVERGFNRIKTSAAEAAAKVAKSAGEMKKAMDTPIISQKASETASENALKSYQASVKSIFDETRTPLEKYEAKLLEIQRALKGGGIDDATAARAMKLAGKEVNPEPKFAGALEVGSREARSAVLAATTGRPEGFRQVEKNTGQTVSALTRIEGLISRLREPAQGLA